MGYDSHHSSKQENCRAMPSNLLGIGSHRWPQLGDAASKKRTYWNEEYQGCPNTTSIFKLREIFNEWEWIVQTLIIGSRKYRLNHRFFQSLYTSQLNSPCCLPTTSRGLTTTAMTPLMALRTGKTDLGIFLVLQSPDPYAYSTDEMWRYRLRWLSMFRLLTSSEELTRTAVIALVAPEHRQNTNMFEGTNLIILLVFLSSNSLSTYSMNEMSR